MQREADGGNNNRFQSENLMHQPMRERWFEDVELP